MNEQKEPVVNIRYRDEIKTRLAQSGQVMAIRVGLTLVALVIVAVIAWHFLRH